MKRGDAVKRLRVALFFNQTQFAALLGVTFGTICHWEKNTRSPRLPQIKKMLELAKKNKVKITFDDFLPEDNQDESIQGGGKHEREHTNSVT